MGDTKRTRERSGKNKREHRHRRDIERALDASDEPPEVEGEAED